MRISRCPLNLMKAYGPYIMASIITVENLEKLLHPPPAEHISI